MASRRAASGNDAERERGLDRLRAAVAERKQARTAQVPAGTKAGPQTKPKAKKQAKRSSGAPGDDAT